MQIGVYDNLKSSGSAWLGDIPTHWGAQKLKFLATVQPSNVDKKTVEGEEPVILCNYTDVYKNEYIDSRLEFMQASATEAEIKKFKVDVGDVIVTKDSETPEDIAVPACVAEDIEGLVCGYHLTQIKPIDLHGRYLFRLFQSKGFNAQFTVAANGVTRFGLPQYAIANAFTPLPPFEEQLAIAQFLDFKTAQIDALIAKKQTLLEKLAEKRTALISHAVTKGLDPSVPMKDSGVAWLGEIPAHWNTIRLRHASDFVTSGSRGWAEFYSNEGSVFLRITNVSRHSVQLLLNDIRRVSPPDTAEGKRTATKGGDVIISITADLGSVAVVPDGFESAYVSQHLALVRPNSNHVTGQWLAYQIFSSAGQAQLLGAGYGGTKIQLGLNDIKDMWLALPPEHEQKDICLRISAALDATERQVYSITMVIDRLQEYRSALITNAVTGKIDVRGIKVPPQSEQQELAHA
ncbi:MAG: restriction endonuclease subunit S [Methylomonas sp.]|jgi:type I restriction enzyme S subunit|uniref:restriction endonuclease subunit S n=1 Tax=Methylomonas sp. TaxID=418 RepID=UPI0025F73852|nr:restriction endonuclease subunit S [Methylomonas sp.]MCK9609306.1 restriction endonuclease subunit S [Methylomonas sp.]